MSKTFIRCTARKPTNALINAIRWRQGQQMLKLTPCKTTSKTEAQSKKIFYDYFQNIEKICNKAY